MSKEEHVVAKIVNDPDADTYGVTCACGYSLVSSKGRFLSEWRRHLRRKTFPKNTGEDKK